MKGRILVVVVLLVTGIFLVHQVFFKQVPLKVIPSLIHSTTTVTDVPKNSMDSAIMVPYWTITPEALPTQYDTAIYFGITANTAGVSTQEDGYKDIPRFLHMTSPQQKILLTVRLLDQDTDEKILHDSELQKLIISQSVAIAKKNSFDGIVLDLEYRALAFDEVVKGVTQLSTNFAASSHAQGLTFYQALYGDSFYRLRPYDVGAIGKVSNGIFILAYDFHKASGNPGPNFPFQQLPDEQYSFTQMLADFTSKVPSQKITIVFGLFGYDWQVDSKGQSVKQATSVTTAEASQLLGSGCTLLQCRAIRDTAAGEMKTTYVDDDKNKHVIWWEDMTSIQKKEAYAKSKGITSSGFWAWGYF